MRRLLLILACCPAALAQLDSNVLTVTASRNLNLQPDQAGLMVNVTSNVNTSLDDVLAVLQPTKITAANFTSVGTTFYGDNSAAAPNESWYWTFTLAVPLTSLRDSLASLATVRQTLSQAKTSMDLEYYVQGASISPQLLASNPCPYPAVFSDAQAQAQKVAAAAGITLGPVVSLTDGYGMAIQASFASAGSFLAVTGALSGFLSAPGPVASTPSCALVVTFTLGQQ